MERYEPILKGAEMSQIIRGFKRNHGRTAGTLLSLSLACGVAAAAPPSITPPAAAAESCIVDEIHWQWKGGENKKLNGTHDSTADIQFDWSLKDPVNVGDSFVVSLPKEIKPVRGSELSILAEDQTEVIATGTWNSGTNEATFTLTDYAETHSSLRGSTWFTVTWTVWSDLPASDTDYSLPFSSCRGKSHLPAHWIAPASGPGGELQHGTKVGYLLGEQPGWVVYLGTAKEDIKRPVTVIDNAGNNWAPVCDEISVISTVDDDAGIYVPIDRSRWTLNYCNADGFSLRFNPLDDGSYLLKNESLSISYSGEVLPESENTRYLDNSSHTFGINNNGEPADKSDILNAFIDRGASGGSGIGDEKSVSVGNYVFHDVNENGIQDSEDLPIPGVKLKIQNSDGTRVTRDYRNHDYSEVKKNIDRTDASGHYLFTGLPYSTDGEVGRAYTVSIDLDDDQTRAILAMYTPTLTGKGNLHTDSSTWTANSNTLTRVGERDFSLDFGFIKKLDASVPDIKLVKYIDGHDANAGASAKDTRQTDDDQKPVTFAVGDTRPVTIIVTNTGTVDLTDVVVTDETVLGNDTVTDLTCPEDNELGIGDSMRCTGTLSMTAPGMKHRDRASVTALPAPRDGQRVVTAEGKDWIEGQTLTDSDIANAITPAAHGILGMSSASCGWMCALLPLVPLTPLIPLIGVPDSLGASPSHALGSSKLSSPNRNPVRQSTSAQALPDNEPPIGEQDSTRETRANEKDVLAQTGANTIPLFIIGMIALILGGFLLSRRKTI
ncbi:Ig-like domain-containing protein [Corynebacterium sp. P7202]|uniref:Ig-like domain-containing protein n=1 Tax=Corynebacterium pygosceleis TaxID=2800406 RepID=A0A9Q4C9Y9_9CORY|nr:Ig-like domain-containing protein [Corynebacterium pygosceleis]MCK7638358.1 Ig-like domain-containing protein [Corynebacterium pygosceleis]MCX7469021.1 Ig-like domain-containing protein [Corynebacterium pygosceleis]